MAGNAGGGHGASVGSWVACLVIVVGFLLGGIALVVWNWPLFWLSVAIIVIGCIIARASNIMDDVMEYGGGGAGDPEATT